MALDNKLFKYIHFHSNNSTWFGGTAPEEVHDVTTTQGQEEGRPHTAGDEVEERWLGRLEDMHHPNGEQKSDDVGEEGNEEVGP